MAILKNAGIALLMSVLTAVSVQAQNASAQTEPKEDVEIIVVMSRTSLCIGDGHLGLRMLVINKGEDPVNLDVNRLYVTPASIIALIDTSQMKYRFESVGFNWDPMFPRPSKIITVPAKGYFEREIELPIDDPMFSREGYYSLYLSTSVRVEQPSRVRRVDGDTTAIFEIRSCQSTRP